MFGFEKKQPAPRGKYICTLPKERIDKANKLRSYLTFGSTLLLAAALFIPQDNMYGLVKILWLATLYCIFMVALIVVSVWTSYTMVRGAKIEPEMSDKYAPKGGFDKGTFRPFEWFTAMHVIWAAIQIALVIWSFDVGGVIVTTVAVASLALAAAARQVSFNALKGNTEYIPPEGQTPVGVDEKQDDEGEEPDKDKKQEENEKSDDKCETRDKEEKSDTKVEDPEEIEEAEDFYGDGERK